MPGPTTEELEEFLRGPEARAALQEMGALPTDAVPRAHRLTIEQCHHHAIPLLAELSRKGLNRAHQRQVMKKATELLDRSA